MKKSGDHLDFYRKSNHKYLVLIFRFYLYYRQSRRPWLGMEVTNLYAARLRILERIISKFPDVLKGVIVEEVCSLLLKIFLWRIDLLDAIDAPSIL